MRALGQSSCLLPAPPILLALGSERLPGPQSLPAAAPLMAVCVTDL
jgi:hypothetical protein